MDEIYSSGADVLCTNSCSCDADSSEWPDDIATNMVTSSLGVSCLTDCPIDGISTYDDETYVPLLEALETTFNCAGLCETAVYFMFSEVDK
jgi:hypothetical protein